VSTSAQELEDNLCKLLGIDIDQMAWDLVKDDFIKQTKDTHNTKSDHTTLNDCHSEDPSTPKATVNSS
jgi:hypothetical protein